MSEQQKKTGAAPRASMGHGGSMGRQKAKDFSKTPGRLTERLRPKLQNHRRECCFAVASTVFSISGEADGQRDQRSW